MKFIKNENIFFVTKIILLLINIVFLIYIFFFLKNNVYNTISMSSESINKKDNKITKIIDDKKLNTLLENIKNKKIKNTEKVNIKNFFYQ